MCLYAQPGAHLRPLWNRKQYPLGVVSALPVNRTEDVGCKDLAWETWCDFSHNSS